MTKKTTRKALRPKSEADKVELLKSMSMSDLMKMIQGKGVKKADRSLAAKELWARRSKKERSEVGQKALASRTNNLVKAQNGVVNETIKPVEFEFKTIDKATNKKIDSIKIEIDALIMRLLEMKLAL